MKKLLTVLSLLLFLATACKRKATTTETPPTKTVADDTATHKPGADHDQQLSPASLLINKDSCILDFRNFRSALFSQKMDSVKMFFTFPVMNVNNEIWYLVLDEKEIDAKKLSDAIQPFTAADFDKYATKLFPAYFIKSLLKVKSESLFKTGICETPLITEKNHTSYNMVATVDSTSLQLVLSLSVNEIAAGGKGYNSEKIEYSIIHIFDIVQGRHLKFKEIRMAG